MFYIFICLYICIVICLHIYIYVCVCLYTDLFVYLFIFIYLCIYICVCNVFIITDPTDLCCAFRTLVRAHRKRRSTAGHGGFYVIFASVRRVS